MKKIIFVFLFIFLFSNSNQMIIRYTTNNIYTWQLQSEINASGDISENLIYINWLSPTNYYFHFANGTITAQELDDLWKHITNHISTNN